jgi:4-hydroxy-4-methyl-2-oxoglutarate aldolase
MSPPHPDTPAVSMYSAIRGMKPGTILVIDGGDLGVVTGDNQGECAKHHGLLGVVVNGGVRDVAGFRDLDMPLFCTGAATRIASAQITAVNVPIALGGVTVWPGDILVGDEDGIVSIPASSLGAVLQKLQIVFGVEREMKEALKRKASLDEITAIIAKKKKR